jgi:hypothetical protein
MINDRFRCDAKNMNLAKAQKYELIQLVLR